MSLELDQPGKEAVSLNNDNQLYSAKESCNGPLYQPVNDEVPPKAFSAPVSTRTSPTALVLTIALTVMTILAAVAASVGGSIALKRQNDYRRIRDLRVQLRNNTEALRKHMIDSANPSNNTSRPDCQPATLSDIKPASNCSEIGNGKTYISASQNTGFTVLCETDYPNSDSLGIWVFTFADCIEACASWNAHRNSPPCYSISYDFGDAFTEESGTGNCFFKGVSNIPARPRTATSSADAQLSGD
ncbi:MAG: hypothetical protein Q9172_005517 [Xanthocarpia lactea]